MSESPASPPFFRAGPERPVSPVVLSVPHAGRDYSPELLRSARLPRATLELLEDRLADRLVWRAVEAGATAFIARAPRAEIDLNRDERELDPTLIAPPPAAAGLLQSARTRGGIGLIPSRIAGLGAIWNARIPQAELDRRLERIHRPYHAALERALAAARERFGAAVLLDCHSMPPRGHAPGGAGGGGGAGVVGEGGAVVFGDRFGTSAARPLVDSAVAAARALGYRTARNAPYAGGYIVARHGRPEAGVHALQIELDRSFYLGPDLRAPGPGFAAACTLIADIVRALESRLPGREAEPIAAE